MASSARTAFSAACRAETRSAGSPFGPFLGALAYELTRVYAAALVAEAWQLILGGVLLLVILFAPGGLWGMVRSALARVRTRGETA